MLAHELCAALAGWLERLMPADARRDALLAALGARFGSDARAVDAEVCAELQAEARRFSRHLDVEWVPEGGLVPDTESRGWPDPDPAEAARLRAGIAAERDGVLRVSNLFSLELAAPFLDQAFEALRGAPAIVLDLRANGGGALDTAMAVLGGLLGPEPVHVSDVVYKDGSQRWHSLPRGEPRRPAAALIGPRTYSSGEALAYHFQAQRLGPLVGERTWEQAGVRPDVPCAEAEALERALDLLRRG